MLGGDYKGLALQGLRSGGATGLDAHRRPDEARRALAELVGRALPAEPTGLPDKRAARVEVPVGRVDPFGWLREQDGPRFYWSNREGDQEAAAVGVADVHEGHAVGDPAALHERLAPVLTSDARLRYYGGLRFDPSAEADEDWKAFGAYRYVLPRFELRQEYGEATLACNLALPGDAGHREEILQQIEGLSLPGDIAWDPLPEPVSRTDSPDRRGWKYNVGQALAAFKERRLGKVVLARRADLELSEDLDPVLLACTLKDATPGCFHFYVEPEDGVAFVGASPERLFRREGSLILSEAVAGTRPRGASAADDDDLRDELLRSVKDRSEHAYVRLSIREALSPLCKALEVEERTSEMKLASRRHLVSKVRGALRDGVTDAEILMSLHPTPAVGGHPRDEALAKIQTLEPFDRGWYAGAVGWIGADASEFAAGIRSGLVRSNKLSLFSGAGIVEGSVPEEEWAEIEQKISDFTRILGLGDTRS